MSKNISVTETGAALLILLWIALWAGFWGGIVWAVVHFARKFW